MEVEKEAVVERARKRQRRTLAPTWCQAVLPGGEAEKDPAEEEERFEDEDDSRHVFIGAADNDRDVLDETGAPAQAEHRAGSQVPTNSSRRGTDAPGGRTSAECERRRYARQTIAA